GGSRGGSTWPTRPPCARCPGRCGSFRISERRRRAGLPARLRCFLSAGLDGADQLAVRGVTAQFPEERAAQALALDEAHLGPDVGRGVVAPPLAALEAVRRAADVTVGGAPGLEHLV